MNVSRSIQNDECASKMLIIIQYAKRLSNIDYEASCAFLPVQKVVSYWLTMKTPFLKLPMFKLEIFDFFENNFTKNSKLKHRHV